MIQNYNPGGYTTVVDYELVFDDGYNNGFAFPCDEAGHLLNDLNNAALANYMQCVGQPEKFRRWNKVVSHKRRFRENPSGDCRCGEHVELWPEYCGACSCSKCGQWYNLFGQELLPPEQWEDD